MRGRAQLAHRVAYEMYIGEIPSDCNVGRVKCSNHLCVNPEHLALLSTGIEERFWTKVKKTDQCWMWVPASFIYRAKNKTYSPRHFAYSLVNGVVDDMLYNLCGNSRCVRPEHTGTARERFWTKVIKSPEGCWMWVGSKLPSGYPHLTFQGKNVYAHRLTYEWMFGPIPDGHRLKRTCQHNDCVNPLHQQLDSLN